MAFAQPLALFFFLLFIPIILLYLLKQRRRRVEVSTLLFWDQILRDEYSVTSMTRLRKLLSLLLQLLIITLLTLALARPVLSRDLLGGRRVVVFLDRSASMTVVEESGESRFDIAKARAAGVLANLSLGDVGMLVTVGAKPDILAPLTDSRKELLAALEPLQVSHETTDFAAALDLLHHLPPDERPTHAYLITDGAFTPLPYAVPENTFLAHEAIGEAKENVGITAFQLRPLPASPRDFEIMFESSNFTDAEHTVPYEVRIADRLVDAGELVLPAKGQRLHTLRQFSQAGGGVEVVLDFEDAFALDNRAYAVLPSPAPLHVALVTEGNLFLESALLTDEEIVLDVIAPGEYEAALKAVQEAEEAYVLVFDGWAPEVPPALNAVYIARWPQALGLTSTGELENPLIVDWDREHPVNRHLQLMNISLKQALRIQAPEGWQTLIQGLEGPLAVYREDDHAALALAFDTRSSDLPLRVAFPILVANAIRHMSGVKQERDWRSAPIGAYLTPADLAAFGQGDSDTGAQEVILGPGEVFTATQATATNSAALRLLSVDRVGIYRRVEPPSDTTDPAATPLEMPLFAANLSSREESAIAPSETLPLVSETPIPRIEERVRVSAEPWLMLAVLAIAFLAAEWFLFHRRWVE